MNTDACSVEDKNIHHITECLSLSCVAPFWGLVSQSTCWFKAGMEPKLEVLTDSSANLGMHNRIGSGRVRHLDMKWLWPQQAVQFWEVLAEGQHWPQRERFDDETSPRRQVGCLDLFGETAICQRTRGRSLGGQWGLDRRGECGEENKESTIHSAWRRRLETVGVTYRAWWTQADASVNVRSVMIAWPRGAKISILQMRQLGAAPSTRHKRRKYCVLQFKRRRGCYNHWAGDTSYTSEVRCVWDSSLVRLGLMRKLPSAHDDDWTDLVWRWWALSWFVARREWVSMVRGHSVETENVAVITSERSVDGNRVLWQLVGSHLWWNVLGRYWATWDMARDWRWVLVDTGGVDPGSCYIWDDVADWGLHLVYLTADVWADSDWSCACSPLVRISKRKLCHHTLIHINKTDSTLISTPSFSSINLVVTSSTGQILVFTRIQPFGSDGFSISWQMYSRHATDSVNCENSSVSLVMKYCPTSTVARNPASVQIFDHSVLLWEPFHSFLVLLQWIFSRRIIGLRCSFLQNWIIISSATLSQSPCWLCSSVDYHFSSDTGPRNDHCPAGNLFANKDRCGVSNTFPFIVGEVFDCGFWCIFPKHNTDFENT